MTVFSVLWLTQVGYFILNFPWLIFLVYFFIFLFFCQLLPSASFLKKSQNCNVTNFCIISNLFNHKYNDKHFSKGNKKQVSLQSHFPCEASFPVKPVSLRSQFPCEASFPSKPVSLRSQFPFEASFPLKPVSLRSQFPCETSFSAKPNQYWMQKFFKVLM